MPNSDITFNTTAGQTIDRELLVAYLNTGTYAESVWSALGYRVTDSSMEYDMGKDTQQDIRGNTFTTLKKPVITQTFDPVPLDASDTATVQIWNLGIREQNVQALANQDLLVVHDYAGTTHFAERYPASAIEITNNGGEGGGTLGLSYTVTYGGTREVGTASNSGGTVSFTKATS